MKVETSPIHWQGDRDRIMAIDFYPNSNFLVTCGPEDDSKMYVKFWEITENAKVKQPISNQYIKDFYANVQSQYPEKEKDLIISQEKCDERNRKLDKIMESCMIKPVFLYGLNGAHTSTVNVCRFSPDGKYLATGGDDNAVLIWVQKRRYVNFGSEEEKVTWSNYKILRGHTGDVYDLSWSPDSNYLASASVDNNVIIWNIVKGKQVHRFIDHQNFVQGVSWDPRNKYLLTQSTDKSVRFYKNIQSKLELRFTFLSQLKRFEEIKHTEKLENTINTTIDNTKPETNNNKGSINFNNYHYYFADEDQCPSFVRRSAFSPDGKICLLVSGIKSKTVSNKQQIDFVVWGVSRKDFAKPLFYIPTLNTPATVVKFCPIVFRPQSKAATPLLDLDYVMVFAVGTTDSVLIYGTDSIKPRYVLTNIHCLPITDFAWNGARMLAISSCDGFISFVLFDKNELGEPLAAEEISDEKFKAMYKSYFEIDISKNVLDNAMSTQPVIVKSKKKKEKVPENAEGINAQII